MTLLLSFQEFLRALKNPIYAVVAFCVALVVGFTVYAAIDTMFHNPSATSGFNADFAMGPLIMSSITGFVIGALITARDYTSGMISRLSRLGLGNARLLLTKLGVAFVVCFLWGFVTGLIEQAAAAVFAGQYSVDFNPSHPVLAIAAGLGLFCGFTGACAGALGVVTKSPLITIVTCVGYVLLIEPVVGSLWPSLCPYIHSGLGDSLLRGSTSTDQLGFFAGLGISCAWLALFAGMAWIAMRQRQSVS